MNQEGIVSIPDDKTLPDDGIVPMLRYAAIYDALYSEEMTVHEALTNASKKKYFHPSTGKVYTFSTRTLYRYLANYKAFKMEGLKRSTHKNKGRPKVIPMPLCEKIFSLKQQLPVRSAQKIIRLLELAGEVDKGVLKERTVSRLLKENGYTRKSMSQVKQHYKKVNVERINELFVSDIKEFWIKDEEDTAHKIYMFVIIDYHSRRIMHAQFYTDGILLRLEDCVKKAVSKFGLCEKLYVDNGSVYIANNFKFSCASLGIKLIYASAYWPQGKGLVESFIGTCSDDFLSELRINPIEDIGKLNEALFGWIECSYNVRPHKGVGGQTPAEAWEKSLRNGVTLKYATPVEIANAFLHHAERKVNTYGVITFETNTYEADVALIGEKVLVRYDPLDLSMLYVYHKNKFACAARLIDLSREQHSQYKDVRPNHEFEPTYEVDFTAIMAEHHQKMIERISAELVSGNHSMATFDVASLEEAGATEVYAAETEEGLARPGFTVQEKESALSKEEYFGVMAQFLGRENLSYQQKELLHKHYRTFKIFNKSLLENALENLKTEFPDAGDNLLFYLSTIRAKLEEE